MKNLGFNFDNSYLTLPDSFYTKLSPEPVAAPQLVIVNQALAAELGLDFSNLSEAQQVAWFSGNDSPAGSEPFAQAYAGHQFGHFNMLGDGRAHVWGEHLTPAGERVDIQLKGSGRTPYSRRGDGRAPLGPMLREYIISEAMHALGIPTTLSLAVVTTGEKVMREENLPGAILTRVAASHIRVGTFEFAAASGDKSLVEALLDYTIERHDPALIEADNKALAFIRSVMVRQADLIVHWMRVGFVHGVMNTDNMTISGETIDYGPCAFMDAYDPNTVFSSIDEMGRYRFGNQPGIARWNLARLADALLPLIDENLEQAVEKAENLLDDFTSIYKEKWLTMMGAKLGFFESKAGDEDLIYDLLEWLQDHHADYTNTFRALSRQEKPSEDQTFTEWYDRWQERLSQNAESLEEALTLMQATNPAIIPRNHKVEAALNAATQGDLQPFYDLLAALKEPYKESPDQQNFTTPPLLSERVYQTFCGT